MITPALGNVVNEIVVAAPNLQGNIYPWWSVVAAYLDSAPTTVANPGPIQTGWVAFGDSYTSGIGAGQAADASDDENCYRQTGGYPWYLDDFLNTAAGRTLVFRRYPCSGDVATDVTQTGGQLDKWLDPSISEIATLSITGNDLKFSDIVMVCIVGYQKNGRTCDDVLSASEALLTKEDVIPSLLYSVWRGILDQAVDPRFVIYQTAYPRFWEITDDTCDTCYFKILGIYWGKYLTQALRDRMNSLSEDFNNKIRETVNQWNANLPRGQIILVEPDETIYPGHHFCEPTISEPQSGDKQNNVAFFYPAGQDFTPNSVDVADIDGDGNATTYNSADCAGNVFEN